MGRQGEIGTQPAVGPAEQLGNQGELELINELLGQQLGSQLGTSEQEQAITTCRGQGLGPGLEGQGPIKTRGGGLVGPQQPTLQGLPEQAQVLIPVRLAAHHQGRWLGRAPCMLAPLQEIGVADQTSAAMGADGLTADQGAIGPSQGLL